MKLSEIKKKQIAEQVIDFIENNLQEFKNEKETISVQRSVAYGKGFKLQVTLTKEDFDFCESVIKI